MPNCTGFSSWNPSLSNLCSVSVCLSCYGISLRLRQSRSQIPPDHLHLSSCSWNFHRWCKMPRIPLSSLDTSSLHRLLILRSIGLQMLYWEPTSNFASQNFWQSSAFAILVPFQRIFQDEISNWCSVHSWVLLQRGFKRVSSKLPQAKKQSKKKWRWVSK